MGSFPGSKVCSYLKYLTIVSPLTFLHRKLAMLATFTLRKIGSFGNFVTEILPLYAERYFWRGSMGAGSRVMPEEVKVIHRFFTKITR